jgi:hypothetical protein
MKRFYSPSADGGKGGWYDEARHGSCEIAVIEVLKQAASLERARAKDEADYIAAVEANDDPMLIINPADYQKRQRAILANPIMIMIANPDCMIPKDAIEVSADDYAALMEAQAAGRMIVMSDRGIPQAIERPVTNEHILATLRRKRNAALQASDWTELPRVRLSAKDRKAWEAFRDALKDFPATALAMIEAGEAHDAVIAAFPIPPD